MKSYILTVYTTDGRATESVEQDFGEDEAMKLTDLLREFKNLTSLSMPVADPLGRTSKIHFNPAMIVAVRLTESYSYAC